ncbi:hypothetical protein EHE19_001515 [Ruminiclostridium herbifermentans]|uniref:Uncharacterized protein n=1 Tax=Ruminiclostridium herbifermentans TaxID=2488810 RepID=A0A7H1VPD9_9FIRM|nr:hypothetical protein [Ruminiclostridium herbifermentans]QNU67251.1 hypothetical protein EHE19_001515 [Ruminiclostridium herbifermentans]
MDCRSCIFDFKSAPEKKRKLLISERESCKKCNNCERLSEAKKVESDENS